MKEWYGIDKMEKETTNPIGQNIMLVLGFRNHHILATITTTADHVNPLSQ